MVYGDSRKATLIGIVVPDQAVLENWYRNNALQDSNDLTMLTMCAHKGVKRMIMSELTRIGKRDGLKSFEQVKDIILVPELFTVENGLSTPTLKLKRNEICMRFRSEIDQLYSRLE